MKTCKQLLDELTDIIDPSDIKTIGQVSPYSANDNCNASFIIHTKSNDRIVNVFSVRKANKLRKMILGWINSK